MRTHRTPKSNPVRRGILHAATAPSDVETSQFGQRLSLRLRVLRHRWHLDRELAAGLPADLSEEHVLRAAELTNPATRRRLARSLRRLVREAEGPPVAACRVVPDCAGEILAWREGLLGLADSLEQPRSVSPSGVAQAKLLLADETSPLYNRASPHSLRDAIWIVADGLKQCPAHDRDTPAK
jgi:hypothetical protein